MKTKIWGLVLVGLLIGLAAVADEKKESTGSETTSASVKTEANVSIVKTETFFDAIGRAFQEISTFNLVNGLNLTEEQIKQLIDCNKELDELRQDCVKEYEAIADEVLFAYGKLKEAVEKNQGIPKEVEHRAFMMEQKVKQMKEEMIAEAAQIEKKAEKILTEGQIEVLNTFNPCLIPPKNLKDPVRAGQASDNEMLINMLSYLRSLPDEIFEREKDKIAEKHLEVVQHHLGKFTAEEARRAKERLLGFLEKLRSMTDEGFELNKSELADELKSITPDKAKELREELGKLDKQRRGGFGRVGMFLLKPEIVIPVLTKRLEMMKNMPKPQPVDLDKVNPASKK